MAESICPARNCRVAEQCATEQGTSVATEIRILRVVLSRTDRSYQINVCLLRVRMRFMKLLWSVCLSVLTEC